MSDTFLERLKVGAEAFIVIEIESSEYSPEQLLEESSKLWIKKETKVIDVAFPSLEVGNQHSSGNGWAEIFEPIDNLFQCGAGTYVNLTRSVGGRDV